MVGVFLFVFDLHDKAFHLELFHKMAEKLSGREACRTGDARAAIEPKMGVPALFAFPQQRLPRAICQALRSSPCSVNRWLPFFLRITKRRGHDRDATASAPSHSLDQR